jgi:hypothetical protein
MRGEGQNRRQTGGEVINGKDDGPLAGWVIAISQGMTFLGDPINVADAAGYLVSQGTTFLGDPLSLSPIYTLRCEIQLVQPSPRHPPQLMTMRQVLPVLTFPDIRSMDLRQANIVRIEELSKKDRQELAKAVDSCEQLKAAMRAEASGIVLASPGARLP